MIGQRKTHQAEIDAACELIDFLKFNVKFMTEVYENQPISDNGMWNRMGEPLEGFIFALAHLILPQFALIFVQHLL